MTLSPSLCIIYVVMHIVEWSTELHGSALTSTKKPIICFCSFVYLSSHSKSLQILLVRRRGEFLYCYFKGKIFAIQLIISLSFALIVWATSLQLQYVPMCSVRSVYWLWLASVAVPRLSNNIVNYLTPTAPVQSWHLSMFPVLTWGRWPVKLRKL